MKNSKFPLLFLILPLLLSFSACDTRSDEEKLADAFTEMEALEEDYPAVEVEPVEPQREYKQWILPFKREHLLELYATVIEEEEWSVSIGEMEPSGVNEMVYGSHINKYAMLYTGIWKEEDSDYRRWGSLAGLEEIAGRKAKMNQIEYAGFDYYNPKFVAWGVENMVPDPEDRITGYLAREIYETTYQKFFRLNAEAYLWLQNNDYEVHQRQYKDRIKNVDFDGTEYLKERYRGVLDHYTDENTTWYYEWTPEIAIGFWLRRGMDSTHGELWEGINKVMNAYDQEWWANTAGEGDEYDPGPEDM